MYAWYVSKYKHNKILGSVCKRFGSVWDCLEPFWERLEAAGKVLERFGAS